MFNVVGGRECLFEVLYKHHHWSIALLFNQISIDTHSCFMYDLQNELALAKQPIGITAVPNRISSRPYTD